jgi:hypothetical protein
MIRKSIQASRTSATFAEVLKSYASDSGGGLVDLLLDSGAVIEGAELVLPRGAGRGLFVYPAAGDEILVLSPPNSDPVALGAFVARTDAERVVEQAELSGAGEYPEDQISIDAAALEAGSARVVVDQGAVYLTPRARVQGALEISSGAVPAQSAAIADPLLAYLEEIRTRLNAIKEAAGAASPEAMQAAIALIEQAPAPPATIASELVKIER